MENICQMDCHNCTLQEGDANKATCASLLMPAMFGKLFALVNNLAAHVDYIPVINAVPQFVPEEPARESKKTKAAGFPDKDDG